VYGLGRIDASGRVADRTVTRALGWHGGDRLTLTASAGVVTARRDPDGLAILPPRAEINHAAATTGDDPELDTLLLRLHTETACRRGGALALRPQDLDPEQCLILLREKGETVRWQPVSPTLVTALLGHAAERLAPADGQLLRYRNSRRITYRRYDHLWDRLGRYLPWVRAQQISMHWIRHTTLTWFTPEPTPRSSRSGSATSRPKPRRSTCTPTSRSKNRHSPGPPHRTSSPDDTGRQIPCSPSSRPSDYADLPAAHKAATSSSRRQVGIIPRSA
jgi:hypothetical protein